MITLPEYKLADFGKVAVLMGGESAEREISLESGRAVNSALCNVGIDAHMIDFNKTIWQRLINEKFERVFIVLHGRGGEDGKLQGGLDLINLPYTGSGVLGSALAMDKIRSKMIWEAAGLNTPAVIELAHCSEWDAVVKELGLPIMVKPVSEGSSFGASKVTHIADLPSAWAAAHKFDDRIMAERWITGDEYTVAIINDIALPVIKLETPQEFYNYEAKYKSNDTKYICPCGLDVACEELLGTVALRACKLLDVSGWARVDLMIDADNQIWLIEVNTIPGMTSHSLVPMAAKQAGITFEQLVVQILGTSTVTKN